jgi:hypothetical protein
MMSGFCITSQKSKGLKFLEMPPRKKIMPSASKVARD